MNGTKLHPASVPVRSLSRSLGVGTLFFVLGVLLSPEGGVANVLVIGAMVLFGILLTILYEFAYYQRFRYQVSTDSFDVQSGVISRRDREVPLRRVQNVDVRQTVLHRALGIAAVSVESAGGGETEVDLRYVDEREADRLRRVLRSESREPVDVAAVGPDPVERAMADEEVVFRLKSGELALLSLFTIDPGASVIATIVIAFVSGVDPTGVEVVQTTMDLLPGGLGVAALAALVAFAVVAWVLSMGLTFTRYYGFTLSRAGDELYYERGLLQRYSGTIPLEKVQTVTVSEAVPFRWFGYGALSVETAGYAPGSTDGRGTASAVPLARREHLLSLAHSVEPFESLEVAAPPGRARERYVVRYGLLASAIVGIAYGLAATVAPFLRWEVALVLFLLVPLAAHLKWRHRGYREEDDYFVARTGFWRRTTQIVPHYRIQSVVESRTVFQRRRHLAHVTADTASSATFLGRTATAYDIDAAEAAELRTRLHDRLQTELRRRGGIERPVLREWRSELRDSSEYEPSDEDTGTVDPEERDGAGTGTHEDAIDERRNRDERSESGATRSDTRAEPPEREDRRLDDNRPPESIDARESIDVTGSGEETDRDERDAEMDLDGREGESDQDERDAEPDDR